MAPTQPLLLALPRELRDEIYLLLALHEHVFTSNSKSRDRSLRRLNKPPEAYIDTRIYVPIRAPANLLGACKQLREECLDTISYLVNSRSPPQSNVSRPVVGSESNRLAARENSDLEELAERTQDDGSVRLTLEIARPIRGNMGAFFPTRDEPSPCFLALLPLLSRVRRVKFVVWGAYDWWRGPQQSYIRVPRSQGSLVKRTSSDETDEAKDERKIAPVPTSDKPNPLTIAIDAMMKHLPTIEEVTVDVLIYPGEFWNWDLAEDRSEGLRGWLDSLMRSQDGKYLRQVYKRLIVCEPTPPLRDAIFYHQLETCKEVGSSSSNLVIQVREGRGEVPEDFNDIVDVPPFTRIYSRTE